MRMNFVKRCCFLAPLLFAFSCASPTDASGKEGGPETPENVSVIEFLYYKGANRIEGNFKNRMVSDSYPFSLDLPSIEFENDTVFADDPDPYVSHINLVARPTNGNQEIVYVDKNGDRLKDYQPEPYDHLLLISFDRGIEESLPAGVIVDKVMVESPASADAINKL